MMGNSAITIGDWPAHDPGASLRARILDLVSKGVPRAPCDERGDGWWQRPGAMLRWEARVRVGDRVPAEAFGRAVEGLIEDGLVIEAWLEPVGRRTPSRVLVLPGRSDALRGRVIRARARPEVLAGEPWAAALSGDVAVPPG